MDVPAEPPAKRERSEGGEPEDESSSKYVPPHKRALLGGEEEQEERIGRAKEVCEEAECAHWTDKRKIRPSRHVLRL